MVSISRKTVSSFLFVAAAWFVVSAFVGCGKPEPVVLRFCCDETFWKLMREESAAFQKIYDIQIVMTPILPPKSEEPVEAAAAARPRSGPAPWRSRPKFRTFLDPSQVVLDPGVSHLISSLNTDGGADLYLTDSPLQIDALDGAALTAHRYPICYLSMSLMVAKGNPLKIGSIGDLFEKKVRIGIMDPSKDGMGLTALDVMARNNRGLSEEVLEALIRQFDRQNELLEALENGQVDAILVWNTTRPEEYLLNKYAHEYGRRFDDKIKAAKKTDNLEDMNLVLDELFATILAEKDFAERINMTADTKEEEIRTIDVSLISLSRSLQDRHCRRFADFLISPLGRKIMRKNGFVPK